MQSSVRFVARAINRPSKVSFIVTPDNKANHIDALKPGFHYPSSRAELTARQLKCVFDTRQLGPSTRVVETGLYL